VNFSELLADLVVVVSGQQEREDVAVSWRIIDRYRKLPDSGSRGAGEPGSRGAARTGW
jgi:hypothetical protein